MTQQDDRRRPSFYWFEHKHVEGMPLPFPQLWVYKMCPECVVIECDCGEMTILTPSMATCWCGADHTTLVRGELLTRGTRGLEDKALHLWRYAKDRESAGLPF